MHYRDWPDFLGDSMSQDLVKMAKSLMEMGQKILDSQTPTNSTNALSHLPEVASEQSKINEDKDDNPKKSIIIASLKRKFG